MSPRSWPRAGDAASAAALALTALAIAAPAGAQSARAPDAPAGVRTASDTVDLVVAATTDVHGRVRGWDYYAGRVDPARSLAGAATIVDSLRRAAPGRVVLVDAGDLLQGNPFAFAASRVVPASRPHPVIAAMNAMRYDAAAVGNHEFNFGLPNLRRAVAQARFPFLAANAFLPGGGRAFPAFRIVERGGVKVGIVGATTPGSLVWDRDNLRDRLLLSDVVPAMANAVAQARRAGAQVIVAVLHSGLSEPSSYDTAATGVPSENVTDRVVREVPGIDLAVYGHTHLEVPDTTIGGVLLMQPRNWAASVGVAHLTVVRDGTRWRVAARRSTTVPVLGHAESPAVLAATREGHEATVRWVNTAVGSTPVAWRGDSARVADTPLTDLVLEVMRRRAGAELAANAAFSLAAGFAPGPITRAQIAQLYPYENTLRVVRVTGAQLRAYLEQTARYYGTYPGDSALTRGFPSFNFDVLAGADYTIDLSRPAGQRVTRLEARGHPVADADTFTLALNNYRQTGGGGFTMLAGAQVVYDRGEVIGDLIADEITWRKVIRPEDFFRRNWEVVPAPAGERAWRAMRAAELRDAPAVAGTPVRKDATGSAAARPRTLRILAMNDLHGALEPRVDAYGVTRGGVGALAAAIQRARAECRLPECTSVLIDAGDEFQGTPASNLAYGRPVIAVMRRLGVAAAALGNHEFDWGVDTLRARMAEAPYAILAANVRTEDGGVPTWVRGDTLVVRDGVRIGIVGLADTATPHTTKVLNVRGLRFEPFAPAASARARALRARGADVVIVTIHAGAFCDRDRDKDPSPEGLAEAAAAPDTGAVCRGAVVSLARELAGQVDVIVSGHTHSRVRAVIAGLPVVQARTSGRALGVIDLPLAPEGGPPRVEVREVVPADSLPPPPAIDSIVRGAVGAVQARLSRLVAEVADPLPKGPREQYALGNLIADAQRAAARADVAIMNNGGIRGGIRPGPATVGALFEVQPFGNTLVVLEVRGRDLRAELERMVSRGAPTWHVSGLTAAYDLARPAGSRVLSVTLADGTPLADDRIYTVACNDFLVPGGDGFALAQHALRVTPTDIVDLDALTRHLGALPQPVRARAGEVRLRSKGAEPSK
jgi:2',3'-cyclic-nucleotide 2'-phosphodiesterase (5'-nucleotidase family)